MAEGSVAEAEWRLIPGFDQYRVSSDGRVQSCRDFGHGGPMPWRDVQPEKTTNGYLRTRFCQHGRHVRMGVHCAVLLAFVGPKPDGMQVRHLNGNKHDNRLDNLRYGTHEENMLDRERHGTTARGSRNGCSRLSEKGVIEIRALRRAGVSAKRIARVFGVDPLHIHGIVRRASWRHVA